MSRRRGGIGRGGHRVAFSKRGRQGGRRKIGTENGLSKDVAAKDRGEP